MPVKFRRVAVKYTQDRYWSEKPDEEWYQQRTTSWNKRITPFYKQFILDPLSARPYITVLDPFMTVEIDATRKGSPVTVDDILFASRALATDDTRVYDKFNIIETKGCELLVLEPEIDNWSS